MPVHGKTKDLSGLALWVALCLGVAGVGGAITRTSVSDWYQDFHKPSFNPPDWVFTPVWISLFVLMGISAWMVWRITGFVRGRIPLTMFGLQLALNLAWSFIFFGAQLIGLALVEIVILWVAILVTADSFRRVSPLAGLLLIPYLLWCSFAVVLNAAIWWLNTAWAAA
jgi:tryptophan-rich sensory protein